VVQHVVGRAPLERAEHQLAVRTDVQVETGARGKRAAMLVRALAVQVGARDALARGHLAQRQPGVGGMRRDDVAGAVVFEPPRLARRVHQPGLVVVRAHDQAAGAEVDARLDGDRAAGEHPLERLAEAQLDAHRIVERNPAGEAAAEHDRRFAGTAVLGSLDHDRGDRTRVGRRQLRAPDRDLAGRTVLGGRTHDGSILTLAES
jgi:hypothetical protein